MTEIYFEVILSFFVKCHQFDNFPGRTRRQQVSGPSVRPRNESGKFDLLLHLSGSFIKAISYGKFHSFWQLLAIVYSGEFVAGWRHKEHRKRCKNWFMTAGGVGGGIGRGWSGDVGLKRDTNRPNAGEWNHWVVLRERARIMWIERELRKTFLDKKTIFGNKNFAWNFFWRESKKFWSQEKFGLC